MGQGWETESNERLHENLQEDEQEDPHSLKRHDLHKELKFTPFLPFFVGDLAVQFVIICWCKSSTPERGPEIDPRLNLQKTVASRTSKLMQYL